MILLFLCIVTTDGKLAVGNLDAQIAGLEHAGHFAEQIPLLLERAQVLGHPEDYRQAVMRAEKLKDGWLLRAAAHTAVHRFSAALADLTRAKIPIGGAHAKIWEAMGDEDKALPILESEAHRSPNISTLGALAALYARLDRQDEARQKFAEARARYRDVSPFALAWVDFQEGLMNERAGRNAAARDLYQAAVDRLPAYAPAVGHLAGVLATLGEKQRALRLLRPLADAMDDPEYAAQSVALEPDEKLRLRTAARYQQLLAMLPDAYADHAARFYLGQPRAIELAKKNLANRHTDDAYQLMIEATLAASQNACKLADEALRKRKGAVLKLVVARAYFACGQKLKADALLTSPPPAATPRR